MTDSNYHNQGIGYVRTEEAPLMSPPASEVGIVGWLRQNMFASMSDFSSVRAAIGSLLMIFLTVVVLICGIMLTWGFVKFTLIDAVWSDPDGNLRDMCLTVAQGGTHPEGWYGACWPFVDAKWKLFIYSSYPTEELWRVNLAFLIGSVGVAWLISDAVSKRWLWGIILIAAGVALAWWATQPIPTDGFALLNDVDVLNLNPDNTSWVHETAAYKLFMHYPIGAWIMVAVGALFLLLVKPFGRTTVAFLMLAVYPVLAFVLLTGGDLEGGTGFWIGLAFVAAFGLLIWLIARIFGEGMISATLVALCVIAAALFMLYTMFQPLTGRSLFDFASVGDGMVIRLPVPADLSGQLTAGFGFLAVIALLTMGNTLGTGMRILFAIPAILMIASGYGEAGTTPLILPVGWVIWLLLALGVIGFIIMMLAGFNRREWHSAVYSFGRGSGWTLFLLALVVALVAFIGGHWFVDLIELAWRGEADKFLAPEHLQHHGGLGLLGIEANSATPAIERTLWPLPVVETSVWGGLLVTLVVAVAGIVASLPLGILLALGRRSQLPAVRILSVGFIEFWRGVPLITVLFMSSVMLPLFLPEGTEFNKLLRALIGVALFASAYMAEVVRGGLQAIPKGQYEGADSLGLGYGQKMRLIVMPQALTLVIPGIVNTFIGLFKDTTLVLIIGLFDLLGAVQAANTDANWASPVQQTTGYMTAAAIFWIFCFGMSRYSMFMENKLRRGHAR